MNLQKLKTYSLRISIQKNLIESETNKFLEIHKTDSSTAKQNKSFNTKYEKKTEIKIVLILQQFTLVVVQ